MWLCDSCDYPCDYMPPRYDTWPGFGHKTARGSPVAFFCPTSMGLPWQWPAEMPPASLSLKIALGFSLVIIIVAFVLAYRMQNPSSRWRWTSHIRFFSSLRKVARCRRRLMILNTMHNAGLIWIHFFIVGMPLLQVLTILFYGNSVSLSSLSKFIKEKKNTKTKTEAHLICYADVFRRDGGNRR